MLKRTGLGRCAIGALLGTCFVVAACSGSSLGKGKQERPYYEHSRAIVDLINDRKFLELAAAFPVPSEYGRTDADRYRQEVKRLLRTFYLEFGHVALGPRALDGTRFYSVSVNSPAKFACHISEATYNASFPDNSDGMLRMIFCDDRPELVIGMLAFGLSPKRADAWEKVVDVCIVTMMAMRWQTNADVAKRVCEQRIPQ